MRSVFRQVMEQQAVNPYILGHVADGSSTFTFTVNGNESVTVPVDANGNWKWVVDRTITSLKDIFNDVRNIDYVEFFKIVGFNNCSNMLRSSTNDTALKRVVFKKCDFSAVTNEANAFVRRYGLTEIIGLDESKHKNNTTLNCTFQYCESLKFSDDFKWENFAYSGITNLTGTFMNNKVNNGKIDLSNIISVTSITSCFGNCSAVEIRLPQNIPANCNTAGFMIANYVLKTITANSISESLNFKDCYQLTAQSVVNLFNAVAADGITLTFHATVYGMIQEQLAIVGSDIYNAYYNKIQQYNFTIASA